MTNLERIQSMSMEDIVDIINRIDEIGAEDINFCKNLEACNDIGYDPYASGRCKECIRDWLMAEAKG